jgi:hypothetical protein
VCIWYCCVRFFFFCLVLLRVGSRRCFFLLFVCVGGFLGCVVFWLLWLLGFLRSGIFFLKGVR